MAASSAWAAAVRILPRPSIRGPRRLRIGQRVYGIPKVARLVRLRDRAQPVAFVVADGLIYALTDRGEASIPIAAEDALRARFGERVPDNDKLFYEDRAAYRTAVLI